MLVPPMLLNHVLVGVLLLPLGWLMLDAARHSLTTIPGNPLKPNAACAPGKILVIDFFGTWEQDDDSGDPGLAVEPGSQQRQSDRNREGP